MPKSIQKNCENGIIDPRLKVLFIVSLTALYTKYIIIIVIDAESRPIVTPSIINGRRTNESVAPTAFIILISSLRLYIVTLMVLDTITIEMTISRAIIQKPIMLMARFIMVIDLTASREELTVSTPSTADICANVSSNLSRSVIVILTLQGKVLP